MRKYELELMEEVLTYAYRQGFVDAVEVFGIAITEKEVDEIINEAKDKASKQLKERFLKMCE